MAEEACYRPHEDTDGVHRPPLLKAVGVPVYRHRRSFELIQKRSGRVIDVTLASGHVVLVSVYPLEHNRLAVDHKLTRSDGNRPKPDGLLHVPKRNVMRVNDILLSSAYII